MQNLKKVFPWIELFYSPKGISSSEATRIAESNKNENDRLMQQLKGELYDKVTLVYSANGVAESKQEVPRLDPREFPGILNAIGENNEQNVYLRLSVKQIEEMRRFVQTMSASQLAKLGGLEEPVSNSVPPTQKGITKDVISLYCELESVESLIFRATPNLLEQVGHILKDALRYEAHAAVLGKQVASSDALIRKVLAAAPTKDGERIQNDSIILETKYEFAYPDKSDWLNVEKDLMDLYTHLQKQRNQAVKIVKDKAREMQAELDAAYRVELEKYQAEQKDFNNRMVVYLQRTEEIRQELLKEVAALKIIN